MVCTYSVGTAPSWPAPLGLESPPAPCMSPAQGNERLRIPQPHRTHPSLPEPTLAPAGGRPLPERHPWAILSPHSGFSQPGFSPDFSAAFTDTLGRSKCCFEALVPQYKNQTKPNPNPMHPSNYLFHVLDVCNTFVSVLTGKYSL